MSEKKEKSAPDAATVRASIERFWATIEPQTYFQVLGVTPDSDADKMKAAYHTLVRKWHADSYAGIELGAAKEPLDAIFSRIQQAYDTLTDPTARAEYMVLIDRQAKGLSTDVSAVLDAERLFDEALAKMKRRDYAASKETFESAMRLNPDDPLMPVHHAWVSYNADRKNRDVRAACLDTLRKAIKGKEDLAIAWQYMGQIYFSAGQPADATRAWRKCLEYEPKNIEASRGIRLVETRSSGPKSSGFGGFLKKLFKRT